MDEELRKAAQDAARWFLSNTYFKVNPEAEAIHEALTVALSKNANAAPDDAIDWEGVAADQAMTIAMMKVDYQQLQALVTSQGVRMMEQEEWQKDAAKYQWLLRLFVYLGDSPAETLDAAIVKTMAKMPLEKS